MSLIKSVKVNVNKGYEIIIGDNVLSHINDYIESLTKTKKIAVISDDTVYNKYGEKLVSALKKTGYFVCSYYFSHGEENKNLTTFSNILSFLAENQFTRKDLVIALGGGVVGDTVGFASATYLRGVDFIQIPTTLLSAVDSSVGGKTGVDLPQGKNLVGAFYQPKLVLIDVDIIKNLPKDIYIDGMGEVLKYAILDKKVFNAINNNYYDLSDLIYLCVDYKRKIVEEDELEQGNRKLLNLGHTPAHAIELLSGYTISHGKAVSLGLKIMLKHAKNQGNISLELYDILINIINKTVGDIACPFSAKELALASVNDKKRVEDYILAVKIFGIEDCRIQKVKLQDLEEVYS